MKRLILHVGSPKTGTTSIQSTLFWSPPPLPFRFLSLDTVFGNQLLAMAFRQPANDRRGFFRQIIPAHQHEAFRQQSFRYLDQSLRACAVKNQIPIFSAETIWGFSKKELIALRDYLQSYGFTIQVIAYLRPPVDYAESIFQQLVKVGQPAEISGLSERADSLLHIVQRMDEVFGRERVELSLFQPAKFPGKCLVRDFCQKIGLDLPTIEVLRENESINLAVLKFMALWNRSQATRRFSRTTVFKRAALLAALRKLAGPPVRFHPAVVAAVAERFAPQQRELEQRLGEPIPLSLSTREVQETIQGNEELTQFSSDSLEWLLGARRAAQLLRGVPDQREADQREADQREEAVLRRLNYLILRQLPIQLPTQAVQSARRQLQRYRLSRGF